MGMGDNVSWIISPSSQHNLHYFMQPIASVAVSYYMHGTYFANITGAPHVKGDLHSGPAKGMTFLRMGL